MTKRFFPWLDNIRMYLSSPPQFKYLIKAIGYNLIALLYLPAHWLEMLLFRRKIVKHQLSKDPIFVLGYWRSGTTYLQQLLCKDPEVGYLQQYDSLFPLGTILHKRMMKGIVNWIFRKTGFTHPVHGVPMTVDFPSEEDIALVLSWYPYTPAWSHMFPKRADHFFGKPLFSEEGSAESKEFMDMYKYFVQRLSYMNNGKQLVLKTPTNTTKIAELIKLFPNAKFVYIERDPKEVFFSNMKLLHASRHQWLQDMPDEQKVDVFLKTYPQMLQRYQETKHLIPKENLAELRFETFCENPLENLKDLYHKLGRTMSSEAEEIIKVFLAENHGKHRYHYEKPLPKEVEKLFSDMGLYEEVEG